MKKFFLSKPVFVIGLAIVVSSFVFSVAHAASYLSLSVSFSQARSQRHAATNGDSNNQPIDAALDIIDVDPGGSFSMTGTLIWGPGFVPDLPAMGLGSVTNLAFGSSGYIVPGYPMTCTASSSYPGHTQGNSGAGGKICEIAFSTPNAGSGDATFTITVDGNTPRSETLYRFGLRSNSGSNTVGKDFYIRIPPLTQSVNGSCSTSHYSCDTGTSTGTTGDTATTYNWSCTGSNGGSSASCTENKACPATNISAIHGFNSSRGETATVFPDDTQIIAYGNFTDSGNSSNFGTINFNSLTQLNLNAPSLTAGAHSISITNNCGNSSSFNFNVTSAPVNGDWSSFGACSATSCGQTGTQTRTCTNPAPANGGANCVGSATQSCSAPACGAGMSGTLTPASPSCLISAGKSSCDINFSWNTINPVGTSAVMKVPAITVASGNGGSNTPFSIKFNSETFYLYNNAILLDQKTVTSSCAAGTVWNGSICAVSGTVPTVTLTASPSSGTSPLTTTLSWSATNSPSSCTASGGWNGAKAVSGGSQVISGLTSSTTFTLSCSNATGTGVGSQTATVNSSRVINGSCGASHYLCNTGTSSFGQDLGTFYTWSCVGSGAPDFGETATCTESKTASSSADLVITDFHLTDASGNAKTTFLPTDRIYPSVTIANVGGAATSINSGFYVGIFSNNPSTIAVGTGSPDGVWAREDNFIVPGGSKTYSVTSNSLNWTNNGQPNTSWIKPAGGSYTARAFVDSFDQQKLEVHEDNNQATSAYTVSSTAMSGTLTPPNSSCAIALNASTCNVTLNWTLANPEGTPTAITATGMTNVDVTNTLSTPQSGSKSLSVPWGGRVFFLYNNAKQLATSTVDAASVTCASGAWDGSKCAAVSSGGWSAFGACSVTICGSAGIQVRTCTNPAPSNGGADCVGSATQSCGTPICAATSLDANPKTIVEGSSTTLVWSGNGPCTGTNFDTSGLGNGSLSVSPTSTTTYTATCSDGKAASVTVIVKKKPAFIEN